MVATALIIGGGIGGLATAIALRSIGIDARVFEQAQELEEIGAGLSVWANGSKALELLGLDRQWRDVSSPLELAETRTPSGNVLGRLDVSKLNDDLGYPSVAAHRGELFRLLLAALPPETVSTGKRCVDIQESGDLAVAAFADGREESADLLVGADGVSSSIRVQLFPDRRLTYAGYATWRGVAESDPGSRWPRSALVRTVGRGAQFGIGEISPGRYLWYATKNQGPSEPEAGGRKATLLRLFDNWHHPIPELVRATAEDEIQFHPIHRSAQLTSWSRGRVTLMGDAAHPIEPALGMGAALALEDAVVLASCLQHARHFDTALASYERSRLPRVRRMVRTSAFLAHSEQTESAAACRLRDLASRMAPESVVRHIVRPLLRFQVDV